MRKIRVGIDINGVIRDFDSQFAKYAREQYDITLKAEDFVGYGFPNIQDASGRKIVQDVFANPTVGRYILEEAPPVSNAFTGYKKLVDHPRIDVYVVSSTKKGYEDFSYNWMQKHGFTEHIKTFFENNKLNSPVQVLIDNKPENVEKFIKNGRDGILISNGKEPYKSEYSFAQVPDLIDAYQYILERYSKFL